VLVLSPLGVGDFDPATGGGSSGGHRGELRCDHRMYDDFLKRSIDVRIKSLHLHCEGFQKPVDSSTEEFKRFHTLMNRRNDYLHGNILFRGRHDRIMYFDHYNIPLLKEEMSMNEFALSHALLEVEPDLLYQEHKVVNDFISLVITSLHEKAQHAVKQLMMAKQIGWDDDRKIPGAILPQTPGEMFVF
jgi:hypothetical protein